MGESGEAMSRVSDERLADMLASWEHMPPDTNTCADIAVDLQSARAQRDEARAYGEKLYRFSREVTCVWCGHQFESTIGEQREALLAHAETCEQSPLRDARRDLALAQAREAELRAACEEALGALTQEHDAVLAGDGACACMGGHDTCLMANVIAHTRSALASDGSRAAEVLRAAEAWAAEWSHRTGSHADRMLQDAVEKWKEAPRTKTGEIP
jgi:hypothetical protein